MRRKQLLLVAKYAILLALVAVIAQTLYSAKSQLAKHPFQLHAGWLFLAAVLYTLGQLPSGIFWHRTLIALGQRPGLWQSQRAFFVGHLGKYVPGKALVVVLRAGLVRGLGVDAALSGVAVFYETFTTMAIGGLVAALIFGLWLGGPWYWVVTSLGLAIVSGLPTWPSIFHWAVSKLAGRWASAGVAKRLSRLSPWALAQGWLSIAVGWGVMGLSMYAVLKGVGDPSASLAQWPRYTAAVALSTVLGFVSLVPAGAGVRELALRECLAPTILGAAGNEAGAVALVQALWLRVVWLIAEVILAACLYLAGKREVHPKLDALPTRAE